MSLQVHEVRKHRSFSVLPTLLLATASAVGAGVTGSATLEGDPPAEFKLKMNADPKCDALYPDGSPSTRYFIVGEGGSLGNVFLYITDPPDGDYPAPETPTTLLQEGCLYSPLVGGIQVDQTLRIENVDEHLHNVRALARKNRPFNLGQPGVGVREKSFKTPEEAIKFKCDVHPWMESYLFVLDHPFYAVTDENGRFEIDDLPAGTYTLAAWHVKAGEQQQEITVGADGSAQASFEFSVE